MTSRHHDDPVLVRIRALLAQAESTTFPEEAEAFTAKATELMVRHAVDAAMVWAGDTTGSAPDQLLIDLHRPFTPNKAILVTRVADAFGCQAVRIGRLADGGERVAVVGFPEDLEMVELLVASLLVQLTTAMAAGLAGARSRTSRGRPTAADVAAWRRSFIMGFVGSVAERLEGDRRRAAAARDRGDDEAGPRGRSTALVLADRRDAVHDDFRVRFPRVRTSSISGGRSAAGHAAGTEAGHRADLARPRLRGPTPIGP